jgi:hypothetical protein
METHSSTAAPGGPRTEVRPCDRACLEAWIDRTLAALVARDPSFLTVTLTNGQTIPIGVKRPWTWEIAELFKVEKGLIRQIEVVSRECPYGMNSGWSSWEDGLSSRAR